MPPERGRQSIVGCGKLGLDLGLCVSISKTVQDTFKVTIND